MKRKIMTGLAGLVLLGATTVGCGGNKPEKFLQPTGERFTYAQQEVDVSRVSQHRCSQYAFAPKMGGIAFTIKDGPTTMVLEDHGLDHNLDQLTVSLYGEPTLQLVEDLREGNMLLVRGVRVPLDETAKQKLEEYNTLLQKLENQYLQEGDAQNSILQSAKEAMMKEQRGVLYFDEAPQGYASVSRLEEESVARTSFIRNLDSEPYDMLKLDQVIRSATEEKARARGLTAIADEVQNLGPEYIAVIEGADIEHAGFDLDETVMQLTSGTKDNQSSQHAASHTSSFLFSRGSSAMNSSSSGHERTYENKKTVNYFVQERINWTLMKKAPQELKYDGTLKN